MALNPFFRQEVASEQRLVQDLVNEHLRMYGQEVYYMPRKYMGTETVMKENVLSKFDDAYAIEAYIANVDGFQGSGDLMSKFGIRVTDEATFIISSERFEDYIGNIAATINAAEDLRLGLQIDRPAEGDLIYFPLTDSLFEIKFVEHENPFYQLGSLYTYELRCELFEYEQEIFDTEIESIDDNVSDIGYVVKLTLADSGTRATATSQLRNGAVNELILLNDGYGYSTIPTIAISTSPAGVAAANATAVAIGTIGVGATTYSIKELKITNPGAGYTVAPTVTVIGDGAGAEIRSNIGTEGVVAVTNFSGGTNYTSAPNIAISTSPVGLTSANAVGEVTVSAAGTVNGIRFTNAGFGYTQAPTFVIDTPSQKRTATGKVSYDTSGVGTITAVEVIDPGFGYTVAPTVTFSDPSGFRSGVATAGVGIGSTINSVTIGYSGASYAFSPTVVLSSPSGFRTGIITAGVGIGSTVNSATVDFAGAFYGSAPTLSVTGPATVDYPNGPVGLGSTAVLTALINSTGIITDVVITNPGYGYSTTDIITVTVTGGISTGSLVAVAQTSDPIMGLIKTFTTDAVAETDRTPGTYSEVTTSTFTGSGINARFDIVIPDVSNGRLSVNAGLDSAVGGGVTSVLAGFTTTGIGATTSGSGDNTATFDVFRDITGGIGTVNVVAQGSGYAAGDTVTLAASQIGGTQSADVTDYVITLQSADISVDGGLPTITLDRAGSGYEVGDTLGIQSANIGGGSSITVTVSAIENSITGIITSLTISDPGFGHTTPPSVLFVGGIGTATGGATINSTTGTVTGIAVTNPGVGYTTQPTVSISDPKNPLNTGNFVYGEMITGQTGLATAFVKTWSAETLTLEVYAVSGDFRVGELLVGSATTITTGNVDFVTSAYYLKAIDYDQDEKQGVDAFADNVDIQTQATDEGIVDWTETNPFGTF